LLPKDRPVVCWSVLISLPHGGGAFRGGGPRPRVSLRVLISSFSCVILMVLKVDMAMAAIEMPMGMNRLGQPGIEISVL
jgi:hypothetical protein